MYILVRTDKEFPIGKIMAHCAHNVMKIVVECSPNILIENWYNNDHTTIVLDGRTLANIERIKLLADVMEIPTNFIEDLSLKEKICCAIGPVIPEDIKDLGLHKLRLYK